MKPTNQYHILARVPKVERWEMPPVLEALARQLVESGRLRINADTERNFVKYSTPDTDRSFSQAELEDPILLLRTKQVLAESIAQGLGPMAVNERLNMLRAEMKKARGIDAEKEMRVARLVVQSAHPAVIATLLREGAEMFVSYSHNVGDLMAVHFWHDSHSEASGLQTSSDIGSAVYVSCGGDPFFEGDPKHKRFTTDGYPSLARMMVIGGQELGHFADLRRHPQHGIVGRFSAHLDGLRPTSACKQARDGDIATVQALYSNALRSGLTPLLRAEKRVKFYARFKYSPPWFFAQSWRLLCWVRFMLQKSSLPRYVRTTPKLMCGEFYETMLSDMAFNLAPEADAYRRNNPTAEEAIACIEALARVPQQVHKWGHAATRTCTPRLYDYYYGTVIPALVAALPEHLQHRLRHADALRRLHTLRAAVRRLFKKRPDYLK